MIKLIKENKTNLLSLAQRLTDDLYEFRDRYNTEGKNLLDEEDYSKLLDVIDIFEYFKVLYNKK